MADPTVAAPPEISVVIPHYNDLTGLDLCLSALARQTLDQSRFEIVVADNMSPAGMAAVAAAIGGRARLVLAPERGAGPARNAGVAATHAAILAFTDADCVPGPGWLAAGIAALDTSDLVGGAMRVSVEAGRAMSGAEAFETVFAFDNRSYVEDKGFTVTANLFCARATFDAVGGFRVGVPEDLEWCRRATAMGYTIGYAADAAVAHPARPDWAALCKKWQRIQSETFGLEVAKPMGRLRWLAKSMVLLPSIVAHAPRIARNPDLRTTSDRLAALGTLVRLRAWRFVDSQRLLLTGRN